METDDGRTTDETEDPTLEDPAIEALEAELGRAIERGSDIDTRRATAQATRFATWEGQSDDGLKHAEDLDVNEDEVRPWEGASDTRIFLSDDIINELTAVAVVAFFRAEVQATPTRIQHVAQAQRVSALMKWLRNVKLRAELRRQVKLCAQYMLGDDPGVAVVGVYWRKTVVMEMKEIDLDAMVAELGTQAQSGGEPDAQKMAILQTFADVVFDPSREADAIAMLQRGFPTVQKGKLRTALVQLRTQHKTRLPRPVVKRNLPCFKAYRLNADIFLPESTTDIQEASAVFCREFLTAAELRGRQFSDGWDADAIEAVIAAGSGKIFEPATDADDAKDSEGEGSTDLKEDRYEVWTAWRRSSDESGVMTLWRTVWGAGSPEAGGKRRALLHDMADYEEAALPFYLFSREVLSQSVFDSRGVTRIAGAMQREIKTQRDCRANYTAMATLPPLKKQLRRPGVASVFGPGMELPVDRGDDVSFLQMPQFPQASVEMERAVRLDVDQYFGRETEGVSPSKTELMRTLLVGEFLDGWTWLFQQAFYLMRENMDPQETLLITGGADPMELKRDDLGGEYELQVSFDVRELNLEFLKSRMEYYSALLPLDAQGTIDRGLLVRVAARGVDPNLADQLIRDSGSVTAKEAADEVDALSKIAVGIEVPPPESGNWQLRLQTLEQTLMKSPQLVERAQKDELFAKMVAARRDAFRMQLQQEQNAVIGRTGFMPTQGAPAMIAGGGA